jgi:type II secretory pathway component PulF
MSELARTYEMRAVHSQGLLRTWLMPLAVLFVASAIGILIVALYLPLRAAMQSVTYI